MVVKTLYLGVDGGASNVTVCVIDDQGQTVYEQTEVGGANYHALGLDTAIDHLELSIQLAAQSLQRKGSVQFERAVFGLAGCNFPSDADVLADAIRKSSLSTMVVRDVQIVNDSQIALRAGTKDGVGLVLIAGTGSNCFGRNSQGQTAQAGGLDHILADEGSGYDMGLRCLRAVIKAWDGRGEATRLTETVMSMVGVKDIAGLHDAIYRHYTLKPQIAAFAQAVFEAANEGDVVALDIIHHSVNALLSLLDAVLGRLEMRESPVTIVQIGSLLHQPLLQQRLARELKRIAPQARLVYPTISAAKGAALMATEGLEKSAEIKEI